ncbi:MAG: hypothetical protein WC522_09400 [Candidatus Omnitrophota bacterium]
MLLGSIDAKGIFNGALATKMTPAEITAAKLNTPAQAGSLTHYKVDQRYGDFESTHIVMAETFDAKKGSYTFFYKADGTAQVSGRTSEGQMLLGSIDAKGILNLFAIAGRNAAGQMLSFVDENGNAKPLQLTKDGKMIAGVQEKLDKAMKAINTAGRITDKDWDSASARAMYDELGKLGIIVMLDTDSYVIAGGALRSESGSNHFICGSHGVNKGGVSYRAIYSDASGDHLQEVDKEMADEFNKQARPTINDAGVQTIVRWFMWGKDITYDHTTIGVFSKETVCRYKRNSEGRVIGYGGLDGEGKMIFMGKLDLALEKDGKQKVYSYVSKNVMCAPVKLHSDEKGGFSIAHFYEPILDHYTEIGKMKDGTSYKVTINTNTPELAPWLGKAYGTAETIAKDLTGSKDETDFIIKAGKLANGSEVQINAITETGTYKFAKGGAYQIDPTGKASILVLGQDKAGRTFVTSFNIDGIKETKGAVGAITAELKRMISESDGVDSLRGKLEKFNMNNGTAIPAIMLRNEGSKDEKDGQRFLSFHYGTNGNWIGTYECDSNYNAIKVLGHTESAVILGETFKVTITQSEQTKKDQLQLSGKLNIDITIPGCESKQVFGAAVLNVMPNGTVSTELSYASADGKGAYKLDCRMANITADGKLDLLEGTMFLERSARIKVLANNIKDWTPPQPTAPSEKTPEDTGARDIHVVKDSGGSVYLERGSIEIRKNCVVAIEGQHFIFDSEGIKINIGNSVSSGEKGTSVYTTITEYVKEEGKNTPELKTAEGHLTAKANYDAIKLSEAYYKAFNEYIDFSKDGEKVIQRKIDDLRFRASLLDGNPEQLSGDFRAEADKLEAKLNGLRNGDAAITEIFSSKEILQIFGRGSDAMQAEVAEFASRLEKNNASGAEYQLFRIKVVSSAESAVKLNLNKVGDKYLDSSALAKEMFSSHAVYVQITSALNIHERYQRSLREAYSELSWYSKIGVAALGGMESAVNAGLGTCLVAATAGAFIATGVILTSVVPLAAWFAVGAGLAKFSIITSAIELATVGGTMLGGAAITAGITASIYTAQSVYMGLTTGTWQFDPFELIGSTLVSAGWGAAFSFVFSGLGIASSLPAWARVGVAGAGLGAGRYFMVDMALKGEEFSFGKFATNIAVSTVLAYAGYGAFRAFGGLRTFAAASRAMGISSRLALQVTSGIAAGAISTVAGTAEGAIFGRKGSWISNTVLDFSIGAGLYAAAVFIKWGLQATKTPLVNTAGKQILDADGKAIYLTRFASGVQTATKWLGGKVGGSVLAARVIMISGTFIVGGMINVGLAWGINQLQGWKGSVFFKENTQKLSAGALKVAFFVGGVRALLAAYLVSPRGLYHMRQAWNNIGKYSFEKGNVGLLHEGRGLEAWVARNIFRIKGTWVEGAWKPTAISGSQLLRINMVEGAIKWITVSPAFTVCTGIWNAVINGLEKGEWTIMVGEPGREERLFGRGFLGISSKAWNTLAVSALQGPASGWWMGPMMGAVCLQIRGGAIAGREGFRGTFHSLFAALSEKTTIPVLGHAATIIRFAWAVLIRRESAEAAIASIRNSTPLLMKLNNLGIVGQVVRGFIQARANDFFIAGFVTLVDRLVSWAPTFLVDENETKMQSGVTVIDTDKVRTAMSAGEARVLGFMALFMKATRGYSTEEQRSVRLEARIMEWRVKSPENQRAADAFVAELRNMEIEGRSDREISQRVQELVNLTGDTVDMGGQKGLAVTDGLRSYMMHETAKYLNERGKMLQFFEVDLGERVETCLVITDRDAPKEKVEAVGRMVAERVGAIESSPDYHLRGVDYSTEEGRSAASARVQSAADYVERTFGLDRAEALLCVRTALKRELEFQKKYGMDAERTPDKLEGLFSVKDKQLYYALEIARITIAHCQDMDMGEEVVFRLGCGGGKEDGNLLGVSIASDILRGKGLDPTILLLTTQEKLVDNFRDNVLIKTIGAGKIENVMDPDKAFGVNFLTKDDLRGEGLKKGGVYVMTGDTLKDIGLLGTGCRLLMNEKGEAKAGVAGVLDETEQLLQMVPTVLSEGVEGIADRLTEAEKEQYRRCYEIRQAIYGETVREIEDHGVVDTAKVSPRKTVVRGTDTAGGRVEYDSHNMRIEGARNAQDGRFGGSMGRIIESVRRRLGSLAEGLSDATIAGLANKAATARCLGSRDIMMLAHGEGLLYFTKNGGGKIQPNTMIGDPEINGFLAIRFNASVEMFMGYFALAKKIQASISDVLISTNARQGRNIWTGGSGTFDGVMRVLAEIGFDAIVGIDPEARLILSGRSTKAECGSVKVRYDTILSAGREEHLDAMVGNIEGAADRIGVGDSDFVRHIVVVRDSELGEAARDRLRVVKYKGDANYEVEVIDGVDSATGKFSEKKYNEDVRRVKEEIRSGGGEGKVYIMIDIAEGENIAAIKGSITADTKFNLIVMDMLPAGKLTQLRLRLGAGGERAGGEVNNIFNINDGVLAPEQVALLNRATKKAAKLKLLEGFLRDRNVSIDSAQLATIRAEKIQKEIDTTGSRFGSRVVAALGLGSGALTVVSVDQLRQNGFTVSSEQENMITGEKGMMTLAQAINLGVVPMAGLERLLGNMGIILNGTQKNIILAMVNILHDKDFTSMTQANRLTVIFDGIKDKDADVRLAILGIMNGGMSYDNLRTIVGVYNLLGDQAKTGGNALSLGEIRQLMAQSTRGMIGSIDAITTRADVKAMLRQIDGPIAMKDARNVLELMNIGWSQAGMMQELRDFTIGYIRDTARLGGDISGLGQAVSDAIKNGVLPNVSIVISTARLLGVSGEKIAKGISAISGRSMAEPMGDVFMDEEPGLSLDLQEAMDKLYEMRNSDKFAAAVSALAEKDWSLRIADGDTEGMLGEMDLALARQVVRAYESSGDAREKELGRALGNVIDALERMASRGEEAAPARMGGARNVRAVSNLTVMSAIGGTAGLIGLALTAPVWLTVLTVGGIAALAAGAFTFVKLAAPASKLARALKALDKTLGNNADGALAKVRTEAAKALDRNTRTPPQKAVGAINRILAERAIGSYADGSKVKQAFRSARQSLELRSAVSSLTKAARDAGKEAEVGALISIAERVLDGTIATSDSLERELKAIVPGIDNPDIKLESALKGSALKLDDGPALDIACKVAGSLRDISKDMQKTGAPAISRRDLVSLARISSVLQVAAENLKAGNPGLASILTRAANMLHDGTLTPSERVAHVRTALEEGFSAGVKGEGLLNAAAGEIVRAGRSMDDDALKVECDILARLIRGQAPQAAVTANTRQEIYAATRLSVRRAGVDAGTAEKIADLDMRLGGGTITIEAAAAELDGIRSELGVKAQDAPAFVILENIVTQSAAVTAARDIRDAGDRIIRAMAGRGIKAAGRTVVAAAIDDLVLAVTIADSKASRQTIKSALERIKAGLAAANIGLEGTVADAVARCETSSNLAAKAADVRKTAIKAVRILLGKAEKSAAVTAAIVALSTGLLDGTYNNVQAARTQYNGLLVLLKAEGITISPALASVLTLLDAVISVREIAITGPGQVAVVRAAEGRTGALSSDEREFAGNMNIANSGMSIKGMAYTVRLGDRASTIRGDGTTSVADLLRDNVVEIAGRTGTDESTAGFAVEDIIAKTGGVYEICDVGSVAGNEAVFVCDASGVLKMTGTTHPLAAVSTHTHIELSQEGCIGDAVTAALTAAALNTADVKAYMAAKDGRQGRVRTESAPTSIAGVKVIFEELDSAGNVAKAPDGNLITHTYTDAELLAFDPNLANDIAKAKTLADGESITTDLITITRAGIGEVTGKPVFRITVRRQAAARREAGKSRAAEEALGTISEYAGAGMPATETGVIDTGQFMTGEGTGVAPLARPINTMTTADTTALGGELPAAAAMGTGQMMPGMTSVTTHMLAPQSAGFVAARDTAGPAREQAARVAEMLKEKGVELNVADTFRIETVDSTIATGGVTIVGGMSRLVIDPNASADEVTGQMAQAAARLLSTHPGYHNVEFVMMLDANARGSALETFVAQVARFSARERGSRIVVMIQESKMTYADALVAYTDHLTRTVTSGYVAREGSTTVYVFTPGAVHTLSSLAAQGAIELSVAKAEGARAETERSIESDIAADLAY